jgi:hypothetical protein
MHYPWLADVRLVYQLNIGDDYDPLHFGMYIGWKVVFQSDPEFQNVESDCSNLLLAAAFIVMTLMCELCKEWLSQGPDLPWAHVA